MYNKLNHRTAKPARVQRGWDITYLTVMLKPLGGNLRDSVVLLLGALGHTGEALRSAFAHGGEHVLVNVLLQACCLLYTRPPFM